MSTSLLWLLLLPFLVIGCTRTQEVDPLDDITKQLLAEAASYLESGAFGLAIAIADSAQKARPDAFETHVFKGEVLARLRRYDESDASYEKALVLKPGLPGVRYNMGNNALRRRDLPLALSRYLAERDLQPMYQAEVQAGRVYAELGVADSARMAFDLATKLDPDQPIAYLRLGQLLKEEGEIEQGIEVTRTALALQPDDLDAQFALGSLLNADGNAQEAAPLLRSVVEGRPWHYWAQYNYMQALLRLGRTDEAESTRIIVEALQKDLTEVEKWRGLTEKNPDQLMLWIRYAFVLERTGRMRQAESVNQTAANLAIRHLYYDFGEGPAEVQHRQAAVALSSGRFEEAVEGYRSILREDPKLAGAWHNLGVAYAVWGRLTQAAECWKTALKIDSSKSESGQLLKDLGDAFEIEDDEATADG